MNPIKIIVENLRYRGELIAIGTLLQVSDNTANWLIKFGKGQNQPDFVPESNDQPNPETTTHNE